MCMSDTIDPLKDEKEKVFKYVKTFLGDGMVDVELDPDHLEIGLEKALAVYRQKGPSSVEESYAFLELVEDQNEYILPKEIQTVREVFRRSIGSRSGGGNGGTLFEPFNLAYTNTYLLSSSSMGGLATYYMFAGYQKLVGKMFGSFISFTFNPTTHKLTILQRPRTNENILMWVYNEKPDFEILRDTYAKPWIRDYTLAQCKIMIGEARSKFGTIASPQGGTQMNGVDLKREGLEASVQLEKDLGLYITGGPGLTWVTG